MTDEQIKHMTERFLNWRLPDNFSPDAGISFTPTFNDSPAAMAALGIAEPMRHNPTGTNLFGYSEAKAMVEYMLEGLPTRPASTEPVDALAEAREALEPVLHWYQGDEYPARPIAELVADIVADLQTDRRQALTLPRLIKAADRLSVCAQTTGGTADRDEELVAAIDEYSKAAELAHAALSRLNAQGEVK